MRKAHSLSLALCLLGFVLCAVSGTPRTLAESFVADVRLGPASQNKTTIYADSDSVTFTQTVETSADVPNTATAKVDFLDYGNPGNVHYSVSSRTQTLQLAGGRQSTNYTFSL